MSQTGGVTCSDWRCPVARSSPTVARRTIARVLRDSRLASKTSAQAAAAHAGLHQSTLSRIERGEVKVEPGTASLLLELYGVSEEDRKALLEVARVARQRGWWQRYRGAVPEWFDTYVGLETEASQIRTYESEWIPGILQTSAYARNLIELDAIPPESEKETEKRLAVRRERQERIAGSNPVELHAVINEAALHRQVGGPKTMAEQLEYLASAALRPNVTIQVLPYEAGGHPASYGSFVLLDFDQIHEHTVVYIEYCGGSLYLEEQEEIATYESMFQRVASAHASNQKISMELIRRAINSHLG